MAAPCELISAEETFFRKRGLPDWDELPLWIPASDNKLKGFLDIDCSAAIQHGLEFSPMDETLKKTLEWSLSRGTGHSLKIGFSRQREVELIREWISDSPAKV